MARAPNELRNSGKTVENHLGIYMSSASRAPASSPRRLTARPPPGTLSGTGDEHAAARADQAALGELLAQAQ